ncbi:kinase-like domain-containing protein [Cladochytrium replicatum]|nr:kinase-like domain-containing protein [Cladochytrium replicatum]
MLALPHEMNAPAEPSLHNIVIKGRWKILNTLGKGAFGEVYQAMDLLSGESVAIKVENPSCKKPVLKLEISIMRRLQGCPYTCRFINCGRFTTPQSPEALLAQQASGTGPPIYSYLVMQLLGANLSELRRRCVQNRFSICTTAILAKQMLSGIEALHEVGVLHRDIKPGNFCLSNESSPYDRARCYLIDFGLSRRYLSQSGNVRESRSKVGFRGTARYASINAHLGRDLSRADDLWSLFYVLIEFLKGQLPWKGKEKEKIGEMKQVMTNPDLIAGLPQPMFTIFEHLSGLGYKDRPDYSLLQNCFDDLFACSGQPDDIPYDWELSEKSQVALLSTNREGLNDNFSVGNRQDRTAEELSIGRNSVRPGQSQHGAGIVSTHFDNYPNSPMSPGDRTRGTMYGSSPLLTHGYTEAIMSPGGAGIKSFVNSHNFVGAPPGDTVFPTYGQSASQPSKYVATRRGSLGHITDGTTGGYGNEDGAEESQPSPPMGHIEPPVQEYGSSPEENMATAHRSPTSRHAPPLVPRPPVSPPKNGMNNLRFRRYFQPLVQTGNKSNPTIDTTMVRSASGSMPSPPVSNNSPLNSSNQPDQADGASRNFTYSPQYAFENRATTFREVYPPGSKTQIQAGPIAEGLVLTSDGIIVDTRNPGRTYAQPVIMGRRG